MTALAAGSMQALSCTDMPVETPCRDTPDFLRTWLRMLCLGLENILIFSIFLRHVWI